jgi:hypothetical protein
VTGDHIWINSVARRKSDKLKKRVVKKTASGMTSKTVGVVEMTMTVDRTRKMLGFGGKSKRTMTIGNRGDRRRLALPVAGMRAWGA